MEIGKKDEYRFTIRFDPDDDRHRLAAQILNSQGRKIARYVARAVLAHHGEGMFPITRNFPQIIKEGSKQKLV